MATHSLSLIFVCFRCLELQPLIFAYFRCLELQPDNLTALMALSVSYTNESLQTHACQSLIEWIKQNPKYSRILSPDGAAAAQRSAPTSYMTQ